MALQVTCLKSERVCLHIKHNGLIVNLSVHFSWNFLCSSRMGVPFLFYTEHLPSYRFFWQMLQWISNTQMLRYYYYHNVCSVAKLVTVSTPLATSFKYKLYEYIYTVWVYLWLMCIDCIITSLLADNNYWLPCEPPIKAWQAPWVAQWATRI